MKTKSPATFVSVLALVAGSGLLLAGPINPPAGAVGSSMKTLAEVEPRIAISLANTPGDADSLLRITQPGSYYLTGNVTGVAGKHGIEIAASGVTLDLNGFQVGGVPGSLTGVYVSLNSATSITVRNGSISNWGGSGLDTVACEATGTLLKDLRCADNSNHGIRLYRFGRAVNCSADRNAAYGFDSYSYCAIDNCGANGNGNNGIDGATSSRVTGCVCTNNGGVGIEVGQSSSVRDCTVTTNNGSGIHTSGQCTISGNICSENPAPGAGISVTGTDCRIEGNSCTGNGTGLSVSSSGNVILRNTCASNVLNWAISSGNVYGTIVDRTSAAGGAVSGNSAVSTLGTTDANANFSY